jgi:3' terminal RNA ribose 2'-O-methyltransferase Hen1
MLLAITTTYHPATDLGYLLHKHPVRFQTFPLPSGKAHVFFPEAQPERCTAALLVEIDPVGLVRRRKKDAGSGHPLQPYVNDRPFVASSFLSVAIARVYGTALSGRCKDRPELVTTPLPLEAALTVVPDPTGGSLLRRLFEPLGYEVEIEGFPLDARFPDWGDSGAFNVNLQATVTLSSLLTHLYVLIPVLDNYKHYWVGNEEVEKLLKRGEGWLASHPERELISRRYLRHQRSLTEAALTRLLAEESLELEAQVEGETQIEESVSLSEERLNRVSAVLKGSKARRVLDLGCGEGKLIQRLLLDKQFSEIVGVDVSYRALRRAKQRLQLDQLSPNQRERVALLHGSLIYQDARLSGFDAVAVVEVIEHLDPARLAAFERVLFEHARPGTVVVTTPNVEYNSRFPSLADGQLRNKDHRFEWTRSEFQSWANPVAERFGYSVDFAPIGPEEPDVGAPSQMGVFTR